MKNKIFCNSILQTKKIFFLDEFSSVGSDKDYQSSVYNVPIISDCNSDNCPEQTQLGQCRALYDYSAKLYDELNLQIGIA